MVLMALFVVMGQTSMFLMLGLMFVGFAFLGLIIPPVSVLALAHHGDIAGTAASVMNTIQLVLGAVAIGVSGALANGTPAPMVLGMASCALLTLVSSFWTFGRQKRVVPA